jgi:hypothetical protein
MIEDIKLLREKKHAVLKISIDQKLVEREGDGTDRRAHSLCMRDVWRRRRPGWSRLRALHVVDRKGSWAEGVAEPRMTPTLRGLKVPSQAEGRDFRIAGRRRRAGRRGRRRLSRGSKVAALFVVGRRGRRRRPSPWRAVRFIAG